MSDSNADQVLGWIGQFIDSIVFTRKGVENSLGRDIADTIIRGPEHGEQGGIMGRCADGVTPEGQPWPENSDNPSGEGYRSKKLEKYGWDETNRRTSQMLSYVSIYGRTTIAPDVVTLTYGLDKPPDASRSPTGYKDDRDDAVTDVQKATWAHQQSRGFYGLGAGDPENVSKTGQAAIDLMIREAGGG